VIAQIAAGEPSTALVLAMHYIYSALPALGGTWDKTATSQLWLESVEGTALINVMRVEPDLGTPARGGMPATTATRSAVGWRVSGHKLYATGSPILRYLVVWARTAGDDPRVGWFLVPNGAPGVSYIETWDHLGMRATGSHDLVLDDVEIPANYALDIRRPGDWLPPDPVQSIWNNLVLAALYNGIAIAARDWLVGYLHERKPSNLGASLATLPRFQMAIGEVDALLFVNARLLTGLANDADTTGYTQGLAGQTSLAKYVVTTNAIRAVDITLALVGNPGLSRSNPLERHHRNVLCGRIHVPQDDIVLLGAGKAALGV
ncbi:MAG: acyl-CoA dehydrogenase family protein, partial [Tepidiformaceae bacterium]